MITKLTIKGYKSIKQQEVNLNKVNILLGSNGVGKSNFISIFSLIREVYNEKLQDFITKKGGPDSFLYLGSGVTDEFNLFFQFNNINRFCCTFANGQNYIYIKELHTEFYREENKTWYPNIWSQNVTESTFKHQRSRQAYYVNQRLQEFDVYHFHDTGDKSPMKKICNINDNTILRRDGSNLAAFLFYLKEKHPNNFKKIENQIRAIAPFFGHFDLNPSRLNEQSIQLEWKDRDYPEAYFNAHHLSDGTLRFICLTTLLLQPNPPQTIIIDEPELGLHPVAINRLAGMIRKVTKKSQIIISTQSINLIDNFDPEDIIITEREDNATTFKRLNSDHLKGWLEDYSLGDLWGQNKIGAQPY